MLYPYLGLFVVVSRRSSGSLVGRKDSDIIKHVGIFVNIPECTSSHLSSSCGKFVPLKTCLSCCQVSFLLANKERVISKCNHCGNITICPAMNINFLFVGGASIFAKFLL